MDKFELAMKHADPAMKIRLGLYMLCKSGKIVLDLNKPMHRETINSFVDLLAYDSRDAVARTADEQANLENNRVLDKLILMQLMKHAIKPVGEASINIVV